MRLFSYGKPACCLAALIFCLESSAQDWPQWRGSRSDGTTRSADSRAGDPQLKTAWHRQLGSAYSNVSVVGNHVVTVFSDGTDDFLVSLDLASGRELWSQKLGTTFQGTQGSEDGPSSSPCILDGTVVAFGPNGDLAGFSLADGNRLWQKNLRDELGAKTPWYGFGSSPVRCGDAMFLPISNADGISGILFRPGDGSIKWKCRGNQVDYQGAYVVEDRNELVVVDAGQIAVLDAETGTEKFHFVHSKEGSLAEPQATPVSESRVLLTFENDASLYEIDRDRQEFRILWTTRELRNSYSPPVCHENAIFGMCGTLLVCVDLNTGKRLWKTREPGARGISLFDDNLTLFSSQGEIVCANVSPQGYQETTRLKIADRGGYTAPVFANGHIVVRNTSVIACATVGESAARQPATETAVSTPAGAFARFLDEVRDSDEPQKRVDEWWLGQQSTPIVENDSLVHFVYRGAAHDVALLGDMTKDRHVAETMNRVGNTDLFYRSYEYAPDGIWHYAFLVDFEKVIGDPGNPATVPALIDMGGNPRSTGYEDHKKESVLIMPRVPRAEFLTEKTERPGGELETVEFKSRFRWITPKPLTVYLPAGYADQQDTRYPVIYLLGGREWLDHANAQVAFDNLMGTQCEPAIVVLIPYHDGSGDRIGGAGYSKMVLNDMVPVIEQRFRTRAPAVAFGAADDATAAIHLTSLSPERFSRLVVYSPYMDEPDFQSLEELTAWPDRCYLDWSRYEPRIQDENSDYVDAGRKLNQLLQSNGCQLQGGEVDAGPGWKSWILRLDDALRFVLPPR